MPLFQDNHLVVTGRTEVLNYTSVSQGRTIVIPRTGLNRAEHGADLTEQFQTAVDAFRPGNDNDFVYLVFRSPLGFLLDLEKLDKSDCRLATYRVIHVEGVNQDDLVYEAAVYLNTRAISKFLRKIEDYIHKTTELTYHEDGSVKGGGNPYNLSLIANIDQIRAATLQSFWQEPESAFPAIDEYTWWEIWMNRASNEVLVNPIQLITEITQGQGIQVSSRYLAFPEHYVFLVRGSAAQLGVTILYTDRLAEIRKPRETADFFTNMDVSDQNLWIQDLVNRTNHATAESTVAVCLLDTGVNRANPLLFNLIPEDNLDAVEPAWSKADTSLQGHGTPMAGLALYGDLTEALDVPFPIQINHHVESVKLIGPGHAHDPMIYGAVTQEAVARAETMHPLFKRMVCMAVTSEEFNHRGRPSAWSSAIDQCVFGTVDERNEKMLFFVSSGNLLPQFRTLYPLANRDHSIQDPAQSFNGITVGAYTLKDSINLVQFPGAELLARRGSMSPCNTTSANWDNDWSRKPDIVFEGGNFGLQHGQLVEPESLQLLSAAKGGVGLSWLTTFCDTSAATALAARFGAELYYRYPQFRPETIRALMIHSSDWTPAMLGNRPISALSYQEKERLFSEVGYGSPNMEKARYSANNSLTLIAEREIKPYKFEQSKVKTDKFHVFDLPWPMETLQQLFDVIVKFKITLSYFIEPNPGNKTYEGAGSYRSHGLRFKMIDAGESVLAFKRRVSRAMREEGVEHENEGGEHWILGERIRNKGSIHKDIWEGTAADLATRNRIAIFPVGGWWKSRMKLQRHENSVFYSLILTIEAPGEDTNIYTPVVNQIAIDI
jgi:hypothetical protein